MTTAPLLHIDDVSVTFGGVKALTNVELQVAPGQIVGLIGPNGAGKTTLINCIAGDLDPSTGRVLVDGGDVRGASAATKARSGIARTFQNLELFSSMTARETVLAALDTGNGRGRPRLKLDERRERVNAALATFGVEKYADRVAASLPYGVRKLIELCRVFVREPRLLLLDEPVAGLTEPGEFLHVLAENLDRLGCGVLLVEHDMETVRRLCEHVFVLDTGRIVASGTYSEIAENPQVIDAYLGAVHD